MVVCGVARGAGISALACHDVLIAAGTESTKEGLGDVSVLLWYVRLCIQVTQVDDGKQGYT